MGSKMGAVEIDFVARTAQLEASVAKVQKQINGMTGEVKSFGKEGVSSMQAVSAGVRSMEGSMNTRAIERFISQSKTLSSLFQTMFPVVGAAAMVGVIAKMGEEFYKTGQKAVQAGNELKSAFGSLTGTMETANAELQVTNDKLHNQLDLLTGKRPNTIKEMLDEDKLAADRFADSLHTVDKNIQAILKENGIGTWSMIAAGAMGTYTHSTSDIDKMVKTDNRENVNNAGYIHDATLSGNKDSIAAAVKNAVDALNRQIGGMEKEYDRYKKLDDMLQKEGRPTEYDAQRNDLSGIIRARQDQVTAYGLNKDNGATTAAVEKAKGDKAAAEESKKALQKFIEEMRKAAEEVTKINEMITESSRTPGLLAYKTPYAFGGGGGQASATLPTDQYDATRDSSVMEGLSKAASSSEKVASANIALQDAIDKSAETYLENAVKNAALNGSISKHQEAIDLAAIQEAEYQKQLAKLNEAMDNATTLQDMQNLQLQKMALYASNQVTTQQSQQNINSTASPFQKSMQDFVTGLDNFSTKLASITQNAANGFFGDIARGRGFKGTAKDALTNISVAGQQKALAMGLDSMAKSGGTMGKIGKFFGGGAKGGPTPVVVTNWPGGGVGGSASGVTGAVTSGIGKVLGIGKDGSNVTPSLLPGRGFANDGIGGDFNDNTGLIGGGGGGTPGYADTGNTNSITSDVQGRRHQALASFITNGWKMAQGGVSSGINSLANAGVDTDSLANMDFLGFANGGDIDTSMGPVMVGEEGPELAIPRNSSTIIPHNKLGGDTHYFQGAFQGADFSGTNAAEVQSKVKQAMMQTHQASVKDAVRVQRDQKKRSPGKSR